MNDIQSVLREMRWCQQWPAAQSWANEIEEAMSQPVGEVGYAWRGASTSQGTHYGVPFFLLSDVHVCAGTKLFAFPPDAAKLKEEGDAWGRELVVRNRELTEAQAEIERLTKDNDKLRRALETEKECIDGDLTSWRAASPKRITTIKDLEWRQEFIRATLAGKEMNHD